MFESDELKLSRILRKLQGEETAKFPWGDVKVRIDYINFSAGGKGRPDSILVLELTLPVLGQRVVVKVPILIEAEKSGIEAAMTDLNEFCERSKKGVLNGGQPSFLEIPMLVTTPSPHAPERVVQRDIRGTFSVRETLDD